MPTQVHPWPDVGWHDDALCGAVGNGWDDFYGVNNDQAMSRREVARAKAICADCPVRQPCLADALRRDDEWGVWGGYTPKERERALALFPSVVAILRADLDGSLAAEVVRR